MLFIIIKASSTVTICLAITCDVELVVLNLLILYYAIVIIFVDGIGKMLQIKQKKYKKK